MVGFAFLAIILGMSYDLASDAARASRYAGQLEAEQQRWRSFTESVELAVLRIDAEGRIDLVNPFVSGGVKIV